MQRILSIIGAARAYVVLIVLSTVSIVLIAGSDSPQISVLRTAAVATYASLQSTTSYLTSLLRAQSENASLREVNMELMEEVMQYRRIAEENTELRRLLSFRQHSRLPLVPAEVVGRSYVPGFATLTLNVGEHDSVYRRMPVISEEGLVGKVIATSPGFSIVQLLTNRDFRATAKVQRSRIDGIIQPADEDMLQMQNIWKTADVAVGDTVITSEFSSTYPAGITIGIITRIGPGVRGTFSDVLVRPRVDVHRLDHVFVVRYVGTPEQTALETKINPRSGEKR